jgi:hypothetical protein
MHRDTMLECCDPDKDRNASGPQIRGLGVDVGRSRLASSSDCPGLDEIAVVRGVSWGFLFSIPLWVLITWLCVLLR